MNWPHSDGNLPNQKVDFISWSSSCSWSIVLVLWFSSAEKTLETMTGPGVLSQWLKWSRRSEDHIRVLNVKNELEKLLSSDPVSAVFLSRIPRWSSQESWNWLKMCFLSWSKNHGKGIEFVFFLYLDLKNHGKRINFFFNHSKKIKKKDLNFLFGPANPWILILC